MVGMPGFWPGFLALDRRTGGAGRGGGGGGRGAEEKYSFTVLLRRINTVFRYSYGIFDDMEFQYIGCLIHGFPLF